jgi:hypothetical protein
VDRDEDDYAMRKLILFLLLLAACDAWAAAPSIANSGGQHVSAFTASGGSVTASLPNNVTAGNMIVVFVAAAGTGTTLVTPTMTGETFVKLTNASITTGNGQIATYTVNSAVGGQKQVTATETGSTFSMHLHVIEVTGQAGSPIDASGNTASTTLSVSTSTATTTANDLVLGFFGDALNNRTLSATGGSAQIEQTNDATSGDAALSEQKTVSSTGTQTSTASGNSGDSCEQGIIAIAGTGGGAAPIGVNKRTKLEKFE